MKTLLERERYFILWSSLIILVCTFIVCFSINVSSKVVGCRSLQCGKGELKRPWLKDFFCQGQPCPQHRVCFIDKRDIVGKKSWIWTSVFTTAEYTKFINKWNMIYVSFFIFSWFGCSWKDYCPVQIKAGRNCHNYTNYRLVFRIIQ